MNPNLISVSKAGVADELLGLVEFDVPPDKGAPRNWLVQAAKLPAVADDAHYSKVVVLLFPPGYG